MKPIVYYEYPALLTPCIGGCAIINLKTLHPNPVGHVSNTKPVLTSRVLSMDGKDFETENTLYRGSDVEWTSNET